MSSPARRHFHRVTAAIASGSGASPAAVKAADNQQRLMDAALFEAYRRLKDIKALDNKIAAKREILPQFDAYVAGVLQADRGGENDTLITIMLWRFDVGDLAGGLEIADYAIRHQLKTPDRYKRDTASLIAEQVAEEALKRMQLKDADLGALEAAVTQAGILTKEADMHDEVRAKLVKAAGYLARARDDAPTALTLLQRALQLSSGIGVKKDIERLEREIKNAGDQGQAPT